MELLELKKAIRFLCEAQSEKENMYQKMVKRKVLMRFMLGISLLVLIFQGKVMKEVNYISDRTSYNTNEGTSVPVFNNLIWLTTKEAASYLRKSVNAMHILVSRKKIRARKYCNRLYFKREELEALLETSSILGG